MKRALLPGALMIGVIIALLLGCAGGSATEPFANLPEAPEMSEDVVLMYWVVAGSPPEIDEAVLLHSDGAVTYLDRTIGRRGEQYVGSESVLHFTELLVASGFGQLESTYRAGKGGGGVGGRIVTIALRSGGTAKRVQWQEPAVPDAIAEAAREIGQFAQAVRASAH